jgi:hypothetical protein
MSASEDARAVLRELLAEALAGGNGNGHQPVPQVPAPPVAAVLRPSTWTAPPAGGELIGGGAPQPAPASPAGGPEHVTLASDADLDRFVRGLLARPPAELEAIRAGRLRFTLQAGAPSGVVRVERGAVTERKVDEAAKAGARLVLGPGAVLTPLARDKARTKGIKIEREAR